MCHGRIYSTVGGPHGGARPYCQKKTFRILEQIVYGETKFVCMGAVSSVGLTSGRGVQNNHDSEEDDSRLA